MFKEEFNKVAGAASAKNQLLKNNKFLVGCVNCSSII